MSSIGLGNESGDSGGGGGPFGASAATDASNAAANAAAAAGPGNSGKGPGFVPKFDTKPLLADAASTSTASAAEENGERRPTGPRDGTTASRQAQARKATTSTSFKKKEKKATALQPVQTTLLGESPLF